MSICAACGDTRIQQNCIIVNLDSLHGRYAMWPACPACAHMTLVQHMSRVWISRRRYDPNWLAIMFRPDQQAEIMWLAGTAVQMRLL